MSFINRLTKRKRIEAMVRTSIENAEAANHYLTTSGLGIIDIVNSFTELWPSTYFNTADDRKIAGLVLAYMMEISEIDIDETNEQGYQLLRFTIEVAASEFRDNAPYTFDHLHRRMLHESHLNQLKDNCSTLATKQEKGGICPIPP